MQFFRTPIKRNGKTEHEFKAVNWELIKETELKFNINVTPNTPKSKMDYAQAANTAMEMNAMYNPAQFGEPQLITAEE